MVRGPFFSNALGVTRITLHTTLDLGNRDLCCGSHALEGPIFFLLWLHPSPWSKWVRGIKQISPAEAHNSLSDCPLGILLPRILCPQAHCQVAWEQLAPSLQSASFSSHHCLIPHPGGLFKDGCGHLGCMPKLHRHPIVTPGPPLRPRDVHTSSIELLQEGWIQVRSSWKQSCGAGMERKGSWSIEA